ncbi:MAG: zincin-like metallopeptidase domain-containing protein [Flavipsychrobacter sp.]
MAVQTKPRKDVYAIVTEKIVEQLEQGTVPWRKPWIGGGVPTNLLSKRPYRGINIMLLAMYGYEHNLFLTSKQLKEIGGSIKPEEHPQIVVFWNFPDEEETEEENSKRKAPILRYYTVFNIAQCEGIPKEYLPKAREKVHTNTQVEDILKGMPNAPKVYHKEPKAYYNPLKDYVNMPKQNSFVSDNAYYSTLLHEIIHATGHHSRCNRKNLIEMSEFGINNYSHEELVAEIGSCYLQSLCDIEDEFEQSAAYIQGWLKVLKNDRRFILSASSQAQKAVDYVLNEERIDLK